MKTDHNDHEDAQEMCEVEQIKVFAPDLGQRGNGKDEHSEDAKQASKDQRCSPDPERCFIPWPSLVIEIRRVEDW